METLDGEQRRRLLDAWDEMMRTPSQEGFPPAPLRGIEHLDERPEDRRSAEDLHGPRSPITRIVDRLVEFMNRPVPLTAEFFWPLSEMFRHLDNDQLSAVMRTLLLREIPAPLLRSLISHLGDLDQRSPHQRRPDILHEPRSWVSQIFDRMFDLPDFFFVEAMTGLLRSPSGESAMAHLDENQRDRLVQRVSRSAAWAQPADHAAVAVVERNRSSAITMLWSLRQHLTMPQRNQLLEAVGQINLPDVRMDTLAWMQRDDYHPHPPPPA